VNFTMKFLEKYKKKKEKKKFLEKYNKFAVQEKIEIDWNKINVNRISLINSAVRKVLKHKDSCKYLEIGCFNNFTFNSISLRTEDKIGVDPNLGGNIKTNSDDFFKNNQNKFDIIFIDGQHEYSQCQRDVLNSIKFLYPNGFIFLHDLIPLNWKMEHVPRLQDDWNGDVWKVGYELSKSSNLDFIIAMTDYGVGIVKNVKENYKYCYLNNHIKNHKFKNFLEIFDDLPKCEANTAYDFILN